METQESNDINNVNEHSNSELLTVKNGTKYIVTSVQYGAAVNKNLLCNLLAFAKQHNVDRIYTFVLNGKYKDEDRLDQLIELSNIVPVGHETLNFNLRLRDMKILAQQINPFTGLNQKLSRDFSYILPSPKIRYLSLANTSKKARVIMSTGCLTKGNYRMQTAAGRKADQQHQFGFVFVEILNNTKFIAYQVEATKKGDFHYLNEKYYAGKKSLSRPEAIVLGDWHTGDTDKAIRLRTIEMLKTLRPKRVVFHDLFNGHSVNHHEVGHLLSELKNFKNHRDSLSKELRDVYEEICFFAHMFPRTQFIVPESNHDLFLERYIDDKKFMDKPENFLFALQMLPEMLKGKSNTLSIGLSLIGKIPKNFLFLKEDQEYRVQGIELGYHGHRGANGSRGTSAQFDRLNLKMITGHEHSPKLYQNGMVVGTSTYLKLSYVKGAGSWMHAHGVLYDDGKYGLLILI